MLAIVFVLGLFFGVILTNAEIISWFRIQEMFHFDSFHMYGIIGSAIAVGALSMTLIKRLHLKTIRGEEIKIEPKKLSKGTIIGGLLFGIGWAMTGACPGPLYALVGTGSGNGAFVVALLSALGGALAYGYLRERLPH